MEKLSAVVAAAANEFIAQERDHLELESAWVAAFYHDAAVAEQFPNINLVTFHNLVEKEIARRLDLMEQARQRAPGQTVEPPHASERIVAVFRRPPYR